MKIGILNMQYSRHNYGALLQAFALEVAVRSIVPDASVEHIDARPMWLGRPSFAGGMLKRVRKYIKAVLGRSPELPVDGNYHAFSDFRRQYLELSPKAYYTPQDFDEEVWDYDMVIVGSDQVFRIQFMKSRADTFFLRFLPDDCKRIAYAASFGVDYWECSDDADFTRLVREALSKFQAVSVREASGVTICRETFGVEAVHALDPTLLLGRDYFITIIEEHAPSVAPAHWSMHQISQDAAVIDRIPSLAGDLGKELKSIYYERLNRWPLPPYAHFHTVPEWLAQIRDTKELVLTDSYHCVCFSILFEKDFLVFPSKSKGIGRMTSLLGILGLEDRICTDVSTLIEAAGGRSKVDYAPVRKRLSVERERSHAFLCDVILRRG